MLMADGVVVVEVVGAVDEDVVDPRTEEARHLHFEESGEFVASEGEESVDEEKEYEEPFQDGVDDE